MYGVDDHKWRRGVNCEVMDGRVVGWLVKNGSVVDGWKDRSFNS